MIRIDRGEEPPALRAARWWRLARAVLAREAGEEVEFVGYDAEGVRGALFTRQHHKCAYCEMHIHRDEVPIEHFRPKKYAVRHITAAEPIDRERYWWLAWSWDNLFLACSTCNGKSRKGNRFPLVEGTAPCALGPGSPRVAPALPVDEAALLVDPGREDPIKAIQFRKQGGRWVPTGRASSARGLATVTILKLDASDSIVLHYARYVENAIEPAVTRILAAEKRGVEALQKAWRQAMASLLLRPEVEFQALSYDVLDQTFDAAFRDRYGLVLVRPGARPKPRTPVDEGADGLDDLPDALAWQVRAIGKRGKDREPRLREALVALCRHRPCAVEALARYTRTGRRRVERVLRALVAEGRLIKEQGHFRAAGGALIDVFGISDDDVVEALGVMRRRGLLEADGWSRTGDGQDEQGEGE